MYRMSGAEVIIRLMARQGVRFIAGIPGGANLPLYDALSQHQEIRHILARHEQGAGFIAQGMARATGKPAVCFATSGPGATNIMTAIADAKADSVPIVCVTGQVPRALIGTDAFQEIDTYGMSIPITKHNFLVREAGELLTVIPQAFRIAVSGRPGPVLVDVPKDVQSQQVEFESWPEPASADPPPGFDRHEIEQAAQMINAAQRPILYLGGGIIQSEASEWALQLVEKASIPAVVTLMALGAIPVDHPSYLGMLGMHAARSTNMAIEECDLLIAAGARFDDRATGKAQEFCPHARIIHINIDRSEIDKIRRAHVGIVGDVATVLRTVIPLVKASDRTEWSTRVEYLKGEYRLRMPDRSDMHSPYGLIMETARLLDDEAFIVTDVGQHQMWTAQAYPFRRPRHWLTSGGLGTMGFGLPAAIGASIACPGHRVVCFSGDGSLLMNIQELATAAEVGANVKVIVMNNNSLGLVHQQQELFYGGRTFACDYRIKVDFARIAAGFGVKSFDLEGCRDPVDMLDQALRTDGPCLVNAPIDVSHMVFPMVPPGAPNKEMIGGEAYAYSRAVQ